MKKTVPKQISLELSVGEVAKRSGVAVSTLHYNESEGLISSWRNQGNQRRYAREVLRRVAVIKSPNDLVSRSLRFAGRWKRCRACVHPQQRTGESFLRNGEPS